MNLHRHLVLLSSICTLSFSLGCGPKKPNGTTPPTTGEPSAVTGDSDGGGDTGGEVATGDTGTTPAGDGGTTPPAAEAKTCKAEVADPALLFSMSMLLRPPKGVEFLPDDGNPTFTQAVMSGGFISTCDGMIKRINVLVFPGDKSAEKTLDEFVASLAQQGYTGGKPLGAKHEGKGEKHVAFEFPAQGGQPASTMYIAAAHRKGATSPPIDKIDNVFVIVYETTPSDYKLLESSFTESAKSLLVVPPA